jgi:hypothetical protein
MILSTVEVVSLHNSKERERRVNAKNGSVEALTDAQIADRLDGYIPERELRAEKERRRWRLRYLKMMANPRTRAKYKAIKKAEYEARRDKRNSKQTSGS